MHDLRDAFRALKATPVVTAVAILSLALGIGANTAIFSILDSLLLSVAARQGAAAAGRGRANGGPSSWTNPIWEQIRSRPELFDGALRVLQRRASTSPQSGETEFVDGLWASGDLLRRARRPGDSRPHVHSGRTIGAAADRTVRSPSSATASGSGGSAAPPTSSAARSTVERVPFTIVGVTPPTFFGAEVGRTFDVAIPLGTEPLIRGKESVARSPLDLVAEHHGAAEAGADDARRRHDARCAACSRRSAKPRCRRTGAQRTRSTYLTRRLRLPTPPATGGSSLRDRYQRPLTTIMVVVGAGAAHRLRQHREPAARARHGAASRAQRAARARRVAAAARAAAAGREPAALGAGAVAGLRLRAVGQPAARASALDDHEHRVPRLGSTGGVLGFTARVAVATALLFGTAPALRATRVAAERRAQGTGTRRSSANDASGSATCWSCCRSRCRSCSSSPPGCSCERSRRSPARDLGFDRGRCSSPASTHSGCSSSLRSRPRCSSVSDAQPQRARGRAARRLSAVTPVSGSTWNNAVEIHGVTPPRAGDASARRTSTS